MTLGHETLRGWRRPRGGKRLAPAKGDANPRPRFSNTHTPAPIRMLTRRIKEILMMNNVLILLALIAAIGAAVGFYLFWFNFTSRDDDDNNNDKTDVASSTPDTGKMLAHVAPMARKGRA